MKKLFIGMGLFLAACWSGYAQDDYTAQNPVPAREVVIVDYFTKANEIPVLYAERVRGMLIEGLRQRNRVDIIDAEYIPAMTPAAVGGYRPGVNYEQMRNNAIQQTGARYIITGHVAKYQFTRSLENGKPRYNSVFNVVVNGYDMLAGEELVPEQYVLSGRGNNIDEADQAAVRSLVPKMNFYVENHFKFETMVLQICEPDEKGRLLSLYVGAGSNMGVKPGDQFLVYVEDTVQGRPIRKELGRITVRNVEGPDAALCSMRKKQAPLIIKSFNSGKTLVAVSDGEALFF